MEVLDRVYKTFKNLDRDFDKSTKTRTQFITDKFGGDINIGSMIILDAISSSSTEYSEEDIEKLTFIKDIFKSIQESKDRLDQLPDFTFESEGLFSELKQVLVSSKEHGTHLVEAKQSQVSKVKDGAIHFASTVRGTRYTPLNKCVHFHAYNEHMCGMLDVKFKGKLKTELGNYYTTKGRIKVVPSTYSAIKKEMAK